MNLYNLCTIQYDKQLKISKLYFLDGKTTTYPGKPWKLLNELCMRHGSNFKGRMESAKYVLKIHKKVPILTCLYMECIFFPTHGHTSDDCIWIQSRMITKVIPITDSTCDIYFLDGSKAEIPVGNRVILKQMMRCEEYYQKITMPVQLPIICEQPPVERK